MTLLASLLALTLAADATPSGLLLSSVAPTSPLGRAGLKDGDRLLTIEGCPVGTPAQLEAAMALFKRRETVLSFRRGDVEQLAVVNNEQGTGKLMAPSEHQGWPRKCPLTANRNLVVPAFGADKARTGLKVVQVVPDSAYARLGLRNGDLVRRVDGCTLTTSARVEALWKRLADGSAKRVDVERKPGAVALESGTVSQQPPELHADSTDCTLSK